MAYPTTPVNGDTIGRNLCTRPQFSDTLANGDWVGAATPQANSGLNCMRVGPQPTNVATILLPGIAVTPATFKISVRANAVNGSFNIGVRPVGSTRVTGPNIAKVTGMAWKATVTDAILAGDTGSAVELYIKPNVSAAYVYIANVRIDYADSIAGDSNWYLDGATPDTATQDYMWDGAAFYSASTAKQIGAPDTTPPTAPTGLAVTGTTPTSITLGWNAATDDTAVTGYNVFEGATKLTPAPITARTYTHSGLSASTSHTYTVTALDAAGNQSAASAPVTGTTAPPPDTTPPPVPANLRQVFPPLDHVNTWIAWDAVTDPSAPVKYTVWEGLSLQNEDTDTPITATTWKLYPGTDRTARCAVQAVDAAGNKSAKSASLTVTPADYPHIEWTTCVAVTPWTADIAWSPAVVDTGQLLTLVGYWIFMQPVDGEVVSVHNDILPPETTSFTFTGLLPNRTYYYMIYPVDSITPQPPTPPTTIPPSGSNGFDTSDNYNLKPPPPQNLRILSVGETSVALAWNKTVDPDDTVTPCWYQIHENGELARDKDGNENGSYVTPPGGWDVPTSTTLYNLREGSTHTYSVVATDVSNEMSEPSDPIAVTLLGGTPPPVDLPPTTPTNLAVGAVTDTTVELTWTAGTDDVGVAGYHVYRDGVRVNGGTPIAETTYTATDCTPGTNVNFRVKTVDTIGQLSPASSQVTAHTTGTPPPADEPPSAPTGLIVTGITDHTVGLAWDDAVDDVGIAGYKVYKNGTPIVDQQVLADTHYTVTGLAAGSNFSFTVRAIDTINQFSAQSAAVFVQTTGTDLPPPVSAPTGFRSTAVTNTAVTLAWNAATEGDVAGYHVYRGGTQLTTTPVTSLEYTADNLTPGTQYSFNVRTVDSAGQVSPPSADVLTTTTGTPPPPTEPPPITVRGQGVADFLQQPDNVELAAAADPLAATVTLLARGYTRGVGFISGEPNAEIAAVITMATARLAAHPEQIPVSVGSTHWPGGGFNGWTLTERYVLNRYRKRGA